MTERRTRWLFFLLLLGQLLLLTAQVPDEGGRGSLLEAAALRGVAPLARGVENGIRAVENFSRDLVSRRRLVDENRRLRGELERLRRQRIALEGVDEELRRLAQAVDYARAHRGGVRVADVIYKDHTSWLQTLIAHVGSGQVGVDQPVVSDEGLVGRVVVVAGPYAKIQLVTDRAAAVGAMVARTRRQGVVQGGGGGSLSLEFIPLQADVRAGDRVVTAGIDGVFPRGITIGTVTSVEPGSELFHRIRLAPAVDFGLLDQVYILDREPLPEEIVGAEPDAGP